MARVVDALLITLGLNASGVDKGIAQAEASINRGVKNIVSKVLAPLTDAFAFDKMMADFTSGADALGKFSRTVRENTQDVQGWTDAIEAAGYDSGGFQGTLTGLDKKLRDLGRWGSYASYELRALGVTTIRDTNGNLKTATQILGELARTADTMHPERFRVLAEAAGIDANAIRLLQTGSKEVQTLVDKYKDLAYTQADYEAASKFNTAMGDLDKTFKAFSATLLRIIVPALSKLADKFAAGINFLRQHEKFTIAFFATLATVLTARLIPAIVKMGAAWLANPMFWILAAIAVIVIGLALLFDDLWTYMEGGESALDEYWSILGTGEEIAAMLAEAWKTLKKVGSDLWEVLLGAAKKFFSYFGDAFESLKIAFRKLMEYIKAIFSGDAELIKAKGKELWEAIKQFFVDAFHGIYNFLADFLPIVGAFLYNIFSDAFTKIRDFAIDIFSGIKNFFTGVFEKILNFIKSKVADLISNIPDFLLPESLAKWVADVNATVSNVGGGMAAAVTPYAPGASGNAAGGVSPAVVAASGSTIDQRSETSVNVGGLTVYTATDNPADIARAAAQQLQHIVNSATRGNPNR